MEAYVFLINKLVRSIRFRWLVYICISFHSCQILSPSETGFVVPAHRLLNITLLTLVATL